MTEPVVVRSPDLDLRKIAESGQCFRLLPEDGGYVLTALGRVLHLRPLPDGAEFLCSRTEFDAVWSAYFDLNTDYARFRSRVVREDRFLTAAADYGRGIRILRQDPWEMLVTFLISQRKNIPAIRSCVEKLCALCGEPLPDGRFAFPTAERVAALRPEELSACSLGYRADYVRGAARLTAEGPLDPARLSGLADGELLDALEQTPGVGPKVASCVALFGYHRLTGFPLDVWMRRVAEREYGGAFPVERYAGFAGVLQQYLFYYARSGGLAAASGD